MPSGRPRVLIAGCGYVGARLGEALVADGCEVWGLRRRVQGLPPSIDPLAADLSSPRTLRDLPPHLDFVVYAAAADESAEDAYRSAYVTGLRNLLDALDCQDQKPKRILFTSSTGVYPQSAGEWVDEDSPAEPEHFSGRILIEGERLVLAGSFPATIVRFGGIYGPGRTRLIDAVRAGAASCTDDPPLYTNRIHRDDCAGALRHLLRLDRPAALYLGVDDEPAPQCDVHRWLAARLSAPPPRIVSGERGRHGSNKRCRNARLVASGYSFRFPTYREGYESLISPVD